MTTESSAASRILVALAAFVVVVAGMRAAVPILVPFLMSLFIAFISAPAVLSLRRLRIPMSVALLIVIALVVSVMIAIAALIGTSLDDFSRSLPAYQMRLEEITSSLLVWLSAHGVDVPSARVLDYFDPGAAMNLVAGMLSGLGGVLKNTFLILLTVVFIILEGSTFPDKLHAAFGPNESFSHFDKIRITVNRYLAIKTTMSLITGIAVTAWLIALRVDYPLLWGLLAFLLNYIPTIGSIIAAVPPVLLALIQYGWGTAGLTAAGYLVVNVILGSIVEPRFMGRSLGLSTLIVFLSLVFWGWVLGPVGMLLSVPLTMTLKIAMDSYAETRWLAVLLGPEIRPAPETGVPAVGNASAASGAEGAEPPSEGT